MGQRHRILRALSEIDPTPSRLTKRRFKLPRTTAIVVYQASSAPELVATVEQLAGSGVDVLGWSLDGHHDERLELTTIGSGRGTRFRHFNRLLDEVDPESYVILLDDDVTFRRGTIQTFVGLASWLNLDLAQPAHGRGSFASYPFVHRVPGHVARRTTFVEIGPLLLMSPRARHELTPFDEEGMGWGTEVDWYLAESQGLRLGIIDGVEILHLRPSGGTYERTAERMRASERLEEVGAHSWSDLQVVRERYWRVPRSRVVANAH